jgi:hypothetical protein
MGSSHSHEEKSPSLSAPMATGSPSGTTRGMWPFQHEGVSKENSPPQVPRCKEDEYDDGSAMKVEKFNVDDDDDDCMPYAANGREPVMMFQKVSRNNIPDAAEPKSHNSTHSSQSPNSPPAARGYKEDKDRGEKEDKPKCKYCARTSVISLL